MQIVCNGKVETVDPPLLPYILVEDPGPFAHSSLVETYKTFSGETLDLQRFNFLSAKECREYTEGLDSRLFKMSHMEEIFIDHPDFIPKFPNTDELKYLIFDIETLSDGSGLFPTPERSYIVNIGWKFRCGTDVRSGVIEDYKNHATNKDTLILREFMDLFKREDPDVVVTYFGKAFDTPFIVGRCKKLSISTAPLQRLKSDHSIFCGRVDYDAWQDVKIDGSLLDLKNRKLETVSKHFGHDAKSIDNTNTKKYLADAAGQRILSEYVGSDVDATDVVAGVYIPARIAMAEFLGIPLDDSLNASNSAASKIFYARELKKLGFITVDTNEDRYLDLEGKYEGAVVRINGRCPTHNSFLAKGWCTQCGKKIPESDWRKPGKVEEVHKIDFASYYATTMITFNLSPETTRIVKMEDYQEELEVIKGAKKITLRIPDENFGKTIVIDIDTSYDSVTKKALSEFQTKRKKLKAKMKKMDKKKDPGAYMAIDTQQQVYKLMGNIMYGYHGLKFSTWGDMAVAIAIVGLCRWMTKQVWDRVGDAMLEIDTDGLYLNRWEEGWDKILTDELNQKIEKEFGITDSWILLEHDAFGPGFFYRMKSYVLQKPNGDIVKHGVALKSSRHPGVHDKAVDTVIASVLSDNPKPRGDLVEEIIDFSKASLHDFVMRLRLNKNPDEYDGKTSLPKRLATLAKAQMGVEVSTGDQLEYIVCRGGDYRLVSTVKDVSEVDIEFYRREVSKVLEIFDIPNEVGQQLLF
jgi:DNA polymerase I